MFREVFSGIAQRVVFENAMTLQKMRLVRPEEVRLEVATSLNNIDQVLASDAKLKARFETVKIVVPE